MSGAWARIEDGSVMELTTVDPAGRFNAALRWADCTSTPATSSGWTASETAGVWSFAAPVVTPPTTAQIAAAAYTAFIAGGLTVASTGTPALDGVYAIDAASQVNIATEAQFIASFAEFTTGATSGLPWQLASGAWTGFPTMASFLAFAKAAGQTVAAAKLAAGQLASGITAVMPNASVTIA